MLSRKFKKARSRRSVLFRVILYTALPLCFGSLLFDLSLSKNAGDAVGFATKRLVTKIISEEIEKCLAEDNVAPPSLCNAVMSDGKLSYVEVDSNRLNLINSKLIYSINERLENLNGNEMKIPLGSLMGEAFLLGRGPMVSIRLYPSGYIKSTAKSSFQSVGINQSNHRITLNLSVEVTAFMLTHREKYQIDEEFLLCEMLIVGDIPEYYTNIIANDEKSVSEIKEERQDFQ